MDVHRGLLLRKHLLAGGVEEEQEAVVVAAGAEQPVAPGVEPQVLDHPASLALDFAEPLPGSPVEDLDRGPCCRGGRCCRSCRCRRRPAACRRARRPARGCRRSSAGAGPGPRCRRPAPRASASRLPESTSQTTMWPTLSPVASRRPSGEIAQAKSIEGKWCGVSSSWPRSSWINRPVSASQSRQTMSSATLATIAAVGRGRHARGSTCGGASTARIFEPDSTSHQISRPS